MNRFGPLATALCVISLAAPAVAQPTADPLSEFHAKTSKVDVVPWLTLQLGTYDWVKIADTGALERLDAKNASPETLEAMIQDLKRFHDVNKLNDQLTYAREPHHVRRLQWFVEAGLRQLRGLKAQALQASGKAVDPLNAFRTIDGKIDLQRMIDKGFLFQPEARLLPRKTLNELQKAVIMKMGSGVIAFNELKKLNERTAELMYNKPLKLEAIAGKSVEELKTLASEHRLTIPATNDRVELLRHMTGQSEVAVRTAIDSPAARENRVHKPTWTIEKLAGKQPSELVAIAQRAGLQIPEGMKDRAEIVRYMAAQDHLSIFEVKRRIVAEIERKSPGTLKVKVWEGDFDGDGRQGFAYRRRGKPGEAVPTQMQSAEVNEVFEAVKKAALTRNLERERAAALGGDRSKLPDARDLSRLRLEVVPTNDILAEYVPGGKVNISAGLLNEIAARAEITVPSAGRSMFRKRVLALILGHEAAHASRIKAERVADTEGLNILLRAGPGAAYANDAELKAALDVFERPTGGAKVDGLLSRLRSLVRYGSTRGRLSNLRRAARGEVDPLAQYRRADGTLKWKELTRDRSLREAGGLLHFGLALFLKELAVVAKTGDRLRIEEFFDGLMTTDFYVQYGLFSLGARAGEVAYAKTLEKFIKPRFVSGVLKSNVILATGLALPQLASGTFEGKAFAISLGTLGLSSAAVKAGAAGIRWLVDLKRAKRAGTLERIGLAGGRLAKLGGWFYTAAEMAVVLLVADELDQAVHRYLDEQAAKDALADAGDAFAKALRDPKATPESIADAAEAYRAAWTDYRDFLYRPLAKDEAILAGRMTKAARTGQIAMNRRKAALEQLAKHPVLRKRIEARHGSVDAYAQKLVARDERAISHDVDVAMQSFTKARERHLEQIYSGDKRDGALLADLPEAGWLLTGAQPGAKGDPYGERHDLFARKGREQLQRTLHDTLRNVSKNRLQAYADEQAVLKAAEDALRAAKRDAAADALADSRAVVARTAELDRQLVLHPGAIQLDDRRGAKAALESAAGR